MSRVIIIPVEKLGVLEHNFRGVWTTKLKSTRRMGFNRLSRVLKDLMLIPRSSNVLGLATGVGGNGELNAYVICEIDQKQGGEVGPT